MAMYEMEICFAVAAAKTWNSLPAEVTSTNALQTFKPN